MRPLHFLKVIVLTVSFFSHAIFAVTPDELSKTIASKLSEVPEFSYIRDEAEKLGVRVYLFGGTAAAFAHYTHWDLLRRQGDKRFQPDRFDFDYTNIFRSTQDFDCVVDGTPEQAQKLQKLLAEKFPYLQGNKSTWEVRPLRQKMGPREALLENPDFLNQHTDSNSTGLIELTAPKNGEPLVRDLRDWHAKTPYFLRDITDQKLHFYFSDSHGETSRAKAGLNPPIFSVIRFLTKAFQYELAIRPEDLVTIKKVIDEFDPKKVPSGYVSEWIEKNGKKLFQHAVNIEYAKDVLDELGLRQKLIEIHRNERTQDSLAWWLSRVPLPTSAVGGGTGKTARELGLDTVAHETRDFLAYESMTRSHTGEPNVLISRNNAVGEMAAFGDGFYTRKGRKGGRGTNITVRFTVDPNAREGADFKVNGDYVIFLNKAAITVIPESLNLTPLQYFQYLAETDSVNIDERAVLEKLKRRISGRLITMGTQEAKEIDELVAEKIGQGASKREVLWSEWIGINSSAAKRVLEILSRSNETHLSNGLIFAGRIREKSAAVKEFILNHMQDGTKDRVQQAAYSAVLANGDGNLKRSQSAGQSFSHDVVREAFEKIRPENVFVIADWIGQTLYQNGNTPLNLEARKNYFLKLAFSDHAPARIQAARELNNVKLTASEADQLLCAALTHKTFDLGTVNLLNLAERHLPDKHHFSDRTETVLGFAIHERNELALLAMNVIKKQGELTPNLKFHLNFLAGLPPLAMSSNITKYQVAALNTLSSFGVREPEIYLTALKSVHQDQSGLSKADRMSLVRAGEGLLQSISPSQQEIDAWLLEPSLLTTLGETLLGQAVIRTSKSDPRYLKVIELALARFRDEDLTDVIKIIAEHRLKSDLIIRSLSEILLKELDKKDGRNAGNFVGNQKRHTADIIRTLKILNVQSDVALEALLSALGDRVKIGIFPFRTNLAHEAENAIKALGYTDREFKQALRRMMLLSKSKYLDGAQIRRGILHFFDKTNSDFIAFLEDAIQDPFKGTGKVAMDLVVQHQLKMPPIIAALAKTAGYSGSKRDQLQAVKTLQALGANDLVAFEGLSAACESIGPKPRITFFTPNIAKQARAIVNQLFPDKKVREDFISALLDDKNTREWSLIGALSFVEETHPRLDELLNRVMRSDYSTREEATIAFVKRTKILPLSLQQSWISYKWTDTQNKYSAAVLIGEHGIPIPSSLEFLENLAITTHAVTRLANKGEHTPKTILDIAYETLKARADRLASQECRTPLRRLGR